VQRHIITDTSKKDFSHLLADYKAARKIRNAAGAAGRAAGRAAGGGGRRGRGVKPGQFDPNAEDRDGDGKVQEGTRFERPAKPSTPDVPGKPEASAAPPKAKRRRLPDEALTESFNDMGGSPTGRRRLGPKRGAGRGVQVRQPGPEEQKKTRPEDKTRAELRKERQARRSMKQKLDRIGQRLFTDYSKKQREKSLKKIKSDIPWLSGWLDKEGITDPDEQMRYVVDWMKTNALDSARRAGMLSPNNQLTSEARKAMKWYDVAHDLGTELADELGVAPEAVYATLAIFSAKTAWPDNVAAALAVARLAKENPILDDAYVERIKKYRIASKTATLKSRFSKTDLTPAERKTIIEKLENAKKLTAEERKRVPDDLQRFVDDIYNAIDKPNDEYMAQYGGVVGKPLMEQGDEAAGYMLKMAELYSFNGKNIKEIDFDVAEDGSYQTKYIEASGVTGHDPTAVHAKVFKIYKEAFGEGRMDEIMSLIDENLGEGAKIRSFYNNIADPDDPEFGSVTIDTHMGGQLLAVPVSGEDPYIKPGLFGKPDEDLGIPLMYPVMAEAIYEIAQDLNLHPREVQSILWEAQRGLWNWTASPGPKSAAVKEMKKWIDNGLTSGQPEFTPEDLRAKQWEVQSAIVGNPQVRNLYDGPDGGMMPASIPRATRGDE
jgi:hypothetical protein